ncbi:DNA polymerase III subunit gamma/tau [Candidatus Bipolaricaulota bacterium]|nr:DNA polymerase III subunit gamma/tau [Candidatus Bipolaricaulota bacterium]
MSDSSGYISLYRRWRPQRFSEVVGQQDIVSTLRNAVTAEEVAHAYLFAGERGIGKTSVARILARAVNCLAPEGGEPCNLCAHCKTVISGRSLDILEIDGASNRGIDQIRRLREEVGFAPTDLSHKVYIIDEVHMLTNEAFNALLKTLEEPPPHVVFVFATTEPHRLPRTIVSRCQAFGFRQIGAEQIAARIREIAEAEQIRINDQAVELLARRAEGGMRDAIVLLEQATTHATDGIDETVLHEMLGIVGRDVAEAFVDACGVNDRVAVLETIERLAQRGKDLETFLGDVIGVLRDRIAANLGHGRLDLKLCSRLLDIKANLFRSTDRRVLLEVGILALLDEVTAESELHARARDGGAEGIPRQAVVEPEFAPANHAQAQRRNKSEIIGKSGDKGSNHVPEEDRARESEPSPVSGEVPLQRSAAGSDDRQAPEATIEIRREPGSEAEGDVWRTMLAKIEGERIAMAAFLTECTPILEGERLALLFHPDHTFHKESLEKSSNFQYLAGMVRRHFGDSTTVDLRINGEVKRKPLDRERLLEKAKLACDALDGSIVKEE